MTADRTVVMPEEPPKEVVEAMVSAICRARANGGIGASAAYAAARRALEGRE